MLNKKSPAENVYCQPPRQSGGFLGGLALGALVGAGLYYYLTSTQEGKKLHGELKKKALEKGGEAIDSLKELVDDIEQKGEEFKKKANQVQQKLEQEAKTGAKQQLDNIQQLRDRGRRAVSFFTRRGKTLG